MTDSLFIGIDAGGSKTAATAALGDRTERLLGPAAQALRDGPEAAAEVVATLIADARTRMDDAPLGGVVVGLAGAGRATVRDAVAEALRPTLADAPLTVTHDAEVAYHAAWGDESGVLLIAGTGSLVFGRTEDGERVRAGGWGAALGDDGSGAALGRAALRALLASLDGGPPSALPDLAATTLGLAGAGDVIAALYTDKTPLADFAPLLLAGVEAGDWVAEAALLAETNGLAKQAGWLATRAEGLRPRLATVGGLAHAPIYGTALDAALERHLPGWGLTRCETSPADGALAMARALAPGA